MTQWYFNVDADGTVHCRARTVNGDGKIVGDAYETVLETEDFYGVPYEALRTRQQGVVVVKDNKGAIQ
jgi:hypothetical protein